MPELYGLDAIRFAERDAAIVSAGIIRGYEAASGDALAPADPRRLFLLTIADVIVQQRNLIDYAAKQNLLAYAEGGALDHLGLMLGVRRLPASAAKTTVRFTLSMDNGARAIPAGTRVAASGAQVWFATDADIVLPDGEISGEVSATCTQEGAAGNGYLPGQINKPVDPLPLVQSVENTTESAGGADIEDDENLRDRIHLAPEGFSNAGSRGAYEFWARSASQLITDVAVHAPEPGRVDVYPLLAGGELPTDEIIAAVAETLNADTVRPLTDLVRVLEPEIAEYRLEASWYMDKANAINAAAITASVEAAASDWAAWQRAKLGRDINPSELTRRLVAAGAKRVEIASPVFRALDFNQLAVMTDCALTFGGMEDG